VLVMSIFGAVGAVQGVIGYYPSSPLGFGVRRYTEWRFARNGALL
jgi:hypothetical protein